MASCITRQTASDVSTSSPHSTNTYVSSPFVQRVWIAMEAKGLQYQYIEVDPYKKPQALLDVNPRGLVPGIRHGDWGCGESTVLMEYVCE
jgi:glutathione S-transferase